jgi:ABC-type nitrate/sulfonate/bicarbonate transport system permease component
MKKIFSPRFLEDVSVRTMIIIGTIQLIIFVSFLQLNGNEIMPKPSGIAISTWNIITGEGFLDNFFSTLGLILKGMGISIAISLILVYISIIPAFSGITTFVSKLRFLTFTGLLFVFTILLKDGSNIKISLLLFGIIPYFVTSLVSYINDIPKKEYELCYSLKFNTWKTLYEVVIRGKFHLVFEVIRQNFAIAWMMITSVEGLCMSEGGLGTMMIKSNKYLKIDDVFGVLLVILVLGIIFDYLFDVLKVWIFPYTDTKRYSKLWINKILSR